MEDILTGSFSYQSARSFKNRAATPNSCICAWVGRQRLQLFQRRGPSYPETYRITHANATDDFLAASGIMAEILLIFSVLHTAQTPVSYPRILPPYLRQFCGKGGEIHGSIAARGSVGEGDWGTAARKETCDPIISYCRQNRAFSHVCQHPSARIYQVGGGGMIKA